MLRVTTTGKRPIAGGALLLPILLLLNAAPTAAAPARMSFQHLNPGQKPDLHERVPVNVVFIGYEEEQIDRASFVDGLPVRSQPLVRVRNDMGIDDPLGITYAYEYDLIFTEASYEDEFFGFLRKRGKEASITDLQQRYNDEDNNRLTIDHNLEIPGVAVEKWLAYHPPAGLDVAENTVFFINWYGRKDFRFHVYTHTGEPDPDTGHDFGEGERNPVTGQTDGADWSKYIAWGGTTPDDEETGLGKLARIWFHDLSAGPEDASRNWNVDSPDPHRGRIPPSWEYHESGFRAPHYLSKDLSRVARYVAVDILFTPSPLYDPALTPPRLPETINLDLNVYEARPGADASEAFLDERLVRQEVAELLPLHVVTADEQDAELDEEWGRCYTLFMSARYTSLPPCHPELEYPGYANLFVMTVLKLAELTDDVKRTDYELVGSVYSSPGIAPVGGVGFADDNYRDGTQSFVHMYTHPILTQFGYGTTGTMIHEIGHHLGLSHTFDGYDYEQRLEFGSWDRRFLFTGSGNGVNSRMSYAWTNWDFSQFDRDNMNRWMTAAYLEQANVILQRVIGEGELDAVRHQIQRADAAAGKAHRLFQQHLYLNAAAAAKAAYEEVLAAASTVGIPVVGSNAGKSLADGAVFSHSGSFRPAMDPIPLRAAVIGTR